MDNPQTPAGNATDITAQRSLGTTANERLFALVIGIDAYLSLSPLTGAVNDAKAVEGFLKSRMNVPPDRIQLLLDRDASRKGITKAFRQLSEESKIKKNDPILIYYAGHGAQLDAPSGWEVGGPERKIQAICPYDYGKEHVKAIPDRTIGGFLDLICEKKGNNITVIFDCCYSASGTRESELGTGVRGVPLDDELPLDLDLQEFSALIGCGSQIATRFGVGGLRSHVLIAACKETEKAREEDKKGRFTAALLDLFAQKGRLETLTYADILKHIKRIKDQNPQVEGIYQERIVFSTKVVPQQLSVRFNAEKDAFILDAGSVHGITKGSHFTIYEDDDSFLTSSPWRVLAVSKVMSSTSILGDGTPGTDLINRGIAIPFGGGAHPALAALPSYNANELSPAFREAIEQSKIQGTISLVEQNAVVKMRLENGHLIFDILDPAITDCGLHRVYYSAKPTDTADDVARILSAGCHFFWHLTRKHNPRINFALAVEFMELEEVSEDEFYTTGDCFSPSGKNLLRDGVIDLNVGSLQKPYGIKLTNNSNLDLFPAAFYFDHSDWSIYEHYHPATARQFEAESPLQKGGGTLTIGYGAGGYAPLSFQLSRENQDLDVGHLKFFFMAKWADLRHIKQDSPFKGAREVTPYSMPKGFDPWVTLQYPIIQRRA